MSSANQISFDDRTVKYYSYQCYLTNTLPQIDYMDGYCFCLCLLININLCTTARTMHRLRM